MNDAIHDLLASADPAALRALLLLVFDAGYCEATGRREAPSDVLIASWINAARDAWYTEQEALRAQGDAEAPAWLLAQPRPPIPGI